MADYIENIVIGVPLVPAMTLLGTDCSDMIAEESKTSLSVHSFAVSY